MAEERTESLGHFEMLWDCEHCGTKRLLGKTQRHCAECGAPQDPTKRYFPEAGEEKKVDGHVYDGADRHCAACNKPMGAQAKNCTHCGAPMDGTKEVLGVAAPVAPPPPKRKTIWPYVLGVVLILGFGIWWRCVRTTDATLAVTGHRWERAIAVEEYGDVDEDAWRDQIPGNASNMMCTRKERSTKKIPDGETCRDEKVDRKDGTFEVLKKCTPKYRSEGVDDDWCSFKVRKWRRVTDVKTAGTGLMATWPTLGVPAVGAQEVPGARRPGNRTESRVLVFGTQTCDDVSEAVWRKYADGQQVKVEVRASTGKIVCSSL
ncbi:MAG: hypothetical protein H0T79_06635 [Deltaproteobacteria bacterium]|nr:hypothetical protein [Deltaproteobacteria bacterium]